MTPIPPPSPPRFELVAALAAVLSIAVLAVGVTVVLLVGGMDDTDQRATIPADPAVSGTP